MMSEKNRWVLLENSEPHTILLTEEEAMKLIAIQRFDKSKWEIFFDEYYEYIEYYSEEEKEQINRLIP